MEDILRFTEEPTVDESIVEYEFHEYEPIVGTNLNNFGEIRIGIETQDLFLHPCESYLLFEGRLTKETGELYVNDNLIALANNGMMHLFSSIKYQLGGQEIETVLYPGQATTMLGLLKYPDDFSKSRGLNQLWYKDTGAGAAAAANEGFQKRHDYIIKLPNPKGSFSFCVPLKHIFGFCEDYNKIIYGFKHQVTLVRKSSSDAIFRPGDVAAGKVVFDKVSWFVPHVVPNDLEKTQLYKTIESKTMLPVAYRMRQCDTCTVAETANFTWRLGVKSAPERPRYIIIGFQTAKAGDQEKNPSVFDHIDVKNIYVTMNTVRYPAVDYNLSFAKQQISRAYLSAAGFRSKYYNMDELVSNSNITPGEFKSLYPLFVFDVSKHGDRLKSSVTDIQIRAQFNANAPAETEAFALIISDRMLSFESDGTKFSVKYG